MGTECPKTMKTLLAGVGIFGITVGGFGCSGGAATGGAGRSSGTGGGSTGTCTAFQSAGKSVSGSGPHDVETNSDAGIRCGTIYRPADLGGGEKYPIFVWGEGGCSQNGSSNHGPRVERDARLRPPYPDHDRSSGPDGGGRSEELRRAAPLELVARLNERRLDERADPHEKVPECELVAELRAHGGKELGIVVGCRDTRFARRRPRAGELERRTDREKDAVRRRRLDSPFE